jgi:hypothetical protein
LGTTKKSNLDDSDKASSSSTLVTLDDPDLLEAMQLFAHLLPKERQEAILEVKAMLGEDDLETMAALEQVLLELPKMEADIQEDRILAEEMVLAATEDALDMLLLFQNQKKNGPLSSWELIWEKRDVIRDAVIQSGKLSPSDAALFKTDPAAWEAELKSIWSMLQQQAAIIDQEL